CRGLKCSALIRGHRNERDEANRFGLVQTWKAQFKRDMTASQLQDDIAHTIDVRLPHDGPRFVATAAFGQPSCEQRMLREFSLDLGSRYFGRVRFAAENTFYQARYVFFILRKTSITGLTSIYNGHIRWER